MHWGGSFGVNEVVVHVQQPNSHSTILVRAHQMLEEKASVAGTVLQISFYLTCASWHMIKALIHVSLC